MGPSRAVFPTTNFLSKQVSVEFVVAVIAVSFINILFAVFLNGFISVLSLKLNRDHILRNETKCSFKQSARNGMFFPV